MEDMENARIINEIDAAIEANPKATHVKIDEFIFPILRGPQS